LGRIKARFPEPHTTLFRAIQVSFEALREEDAVAAQRYLALAVMLEDMAVAPAVQQTLWNVDEAEALETADRFVGLSLAQRDASGGGIRLHDPQLDYVRAQYPNPKALELIRGAVRLSAHVIEKDPRQFASQVMGRLLPYRDAPAIQQFINEIAAGAPAPWLRPLQPALHPPGTGLLRTLEGHSDSVSGVAVTPDGMRAVSASGDNTLKVWDLETGRALYTLEGHTAYVSGVAVAKDGKRAVSASADNTLKVWDLQTGRALRTLEGHAASVNSVTVTPDGERAVSASADKTLKVWDLATGRVLRTLEDHSDYVFSVAVMPDGKRAVSAFGDKTLKVWDLDAGRALRTLEGHTDYVSGVAVMPDGKRAISASADNTLKVWDLATGRALRTLVGHSSSVSGVAVMPDGKRAVSASGDKTLKVWDLDTGRALYTLEGHSDYVSGVAVTPDSKRAVSASGDHTLKVWDPDAGPALRTPESHSDSVYGVTVTPDGKWAVSASGDKTLKVWDLATGRTLHTLEGHVASVNAVVVTPEGKLAVSASWDHTLKVWDLGTGRALRTLQGHSAYVSGVTVTPDGRRAVSASGDKTLKVWDLATGRALRTLKGHSASVNGAAVTPDGKRAVSASGDSTLRVWDLDTGRALRMLQGHSASVEGVAVTPEGKRVVSASADHTLKVWDLETGRVLRELEGHSASVSGVAVMLDGRRGVSASEDNTLKLWDLNTGLSTATFTCDAGVRCCALASGQRIVAGDARGRVHFLSVEPQVELDNPYMFGPPVKEALSFFGREAELQRTLNNIHSHSAQHTLIIGEQRSGKTSLLYQVRNHLHSTHLPVMLSLQGVERNDRKALMWLVEEIYRQVRTQVDIPARPADPEFRYSRDAVDELGKLVMALAAAQPGYRLVLLLDEVQVMNDIGGTFQEVIREILTRFSTDVRAVLACYYDYLENLSSTGSPLPNICEHIYLKPLTGKHLMRLITEPAHRFGYDWEAPARDAAAELSGGHPYYCQHLCASSYDESRSLGSTNITLAHVLAAKQVVLERSRQHFRSGYWAHLSVEQRAFLGALAASPDSRRSSAEVLRPLIAKQIVVNVDGRLRFTSTLFCEWVRSMPGSGQADEGV
jgi:WD40 repeat protein